MPLGSSVGSDTDLIQLASMFAKNYAPYEWKRDVIGFDLYRLTPWLQRIHQSDDLDFHEALIEYLSSLHDTHASIFFPSPFSAELGFTVDIYDGRVLIDSVDRLLLPQAQYQRALALLLAFGRYPLRRRCRRRSG